MHNIARSTAAPVTTPGNADIDPTERREALEQVAGEMANHVQNHFPDRFTISHHITGTNNNEVTVRVQVPSSPDLFVNVDGESTSLADLRGDGDESGGGADAENEHESIESVSVGITAAIVQQMRAVSDDEVIKSRPAS